MIVKQLSEAVACMGNAKDLVALSLAHECDELKLQLESLRAQAQDSSSACSLARELQQEKAKVQSLAEELRHAQQHIEQRDQEIVKTHALVDTLEVGSRVVQVW